MIKNVIIPERIGSYYLFSHTRLGFDIKKTHIRATQIVANGKKCTIKNIFEEPISSDAEIPYEIRASQAIKTILDKAKKYDEIVTSLPSSKVIVKELTLPFKDYEKIASVIRFELESHLPFPAEDASIDFIITGNKGTSSTVLVAAVRNDYINEHQALFEKAGVSPDKITIDLFELYGLYKRIPAFQKKQGTVVLIDIGLHATALAHIQDGALIAIRMLNKGASSLSHAHEQNEDLLRFSLTKPQETNLSLLPPLMRDIQFTFDAFLTSRALHETNILIILTGEGAYYQGLKEQLEGLSPLYSCQILDSKLLLEDPLISFSLKNGIDAAYITSLANALSSPTTESFNLLQSPQGQQNLLYKQLLAGLILFLLLFLTLGTHIWYQLHALRQEYKASEQQAAKQLARSLKVKGSTLTKVLDESKKEVERKENIWFALSPQARISFLQYLEELSILIDRENLGLELKKISMTRDTITLEGRVLDFAALDTFQKELRSSQLFYPETPLQDPNFKSLTLIIRKKAEEV